MPVGSTVRVALESARIMKEFPELLPQASQLPVGIWGRRCGLEHVLHDKDRIEVYRGLRVDPKVARRERFKGQGVKRAGLFSSTRVGGKAGY